MADKIEYSYPVEELDKMIEIYQSGAKPMIPDRMKREVELRYQELMHEIGEGDDDSFESLKEAHEVLKKKVAESKRKATRKIVGFRQLSDSIMAQLEEDMSESIVRNDPGSVYNKMDAQLYADKEERELMQQISRLRNAYYDPMSFKAAYDIIRKGIFHSLKHDYPWMTIEEAVAEFNKGNIKYNGIVPKLFLGFGTKQITDPEILAGIARGEVIVKDKEDDKERFRGKKKAPYNPINYQYDVICDTEYEDSVKLHNRGVDTPLSTMLRCKAGMFDRLALPFKFTMPNATRVNDELMAFDWSKPDAGERYFALKHGKPYGTTETFLDEVYKANGGLDSSILQNMPEFLRSLSQGDLYAETNRPSQLLPKQIDQAAEIEKNILNSLRAMNVGIMQQQK